MLFKLHAGRHCRFYSWPCHLCLEQCMTQSGYSITICWMSKSNVYSITWWMQYLLLWQHKGESEDVIKTKDEQMPQSSNHKAVHLFIQPCLWRTSLPRSMSSCKNISGAHHPGCHAQSSVARMSPSFYNKCTQAEQACCVILENTICYSSFFSLHFLRIKEQKYQFQNRWEAVCEVVEQPLA